MAPLVAVVLAGGKGERFWPLSRRHRPKQFLCLDGSGRSLLQSTVDRILPLVGGWDNVWVITASHLEQGVIEQLPDLPTANLLVEPEGRDTAAAVAWATLEVSSKHGEHTTLAFFPADHWIEPQSEFERSLRAAAALAEREQAIATIGIPPTYASTGYGYIEQGDSLGEELGIPGYRVKRFTEKPDSDTAEAFIAAGTFSWNSGMFIFPAAVALTELARFAPEILEPLQAEGVAAYGHLPKISIDYALMEKTERACILPASFEWDDLGDWNALERLASHDNDNVELAQHVGLDTEGAILYASDEGELIVTIGLEDFVVVRDGRATLIARKDRTQEIKHVLKKLHDHPDFADHL